MRPKKVLSQIAEGRRESRKREILIVMGDLNAMSRKKYGNLRQCPGFSWMIGG